MAICDGCGANAEAEHIRARIERLELATRYRPVHIQALLVGPVPPSRLEDYFYASEAKAAELQRSGMFLVYAAECPPAEGADTREVVRRAAANLVLRVRHSYKPKSIVLFGPAASELIAPLRDAGFGEQLVLQDGKAFPELADLPRAAGQH